MPTAGGYDGAGNRTGLAVTLPAAPGYAGTTTYAYDAKDQLTQESSTRGGGYGSAFAYDGAGNPTTFRGGSVGAASADNQLPGSAYDGDGSPTTYKGAAAAYDPEGRLTQYGGVTSAYTGGGLRAAKTAGGTTTYFLYDGEEPVCEMDGSGSVTATQTFGPTGLLARHTASGSALYTWDLSGNLAQRVNTGGGILDSAVSDGFGAATTSDNTADPFSGFGGQWGGYTDAQTGLTLFTHRFYDTGTGRFLTRDPSGYAGGLNLYAYADNSPVCWGDASGFGVFNFGGTFTGRPGRVSAGGSGGIAIQFPGAGNDHGGWDIEGYGTLSGGNGIGAGGGLAGNAGIGFGTLGGFNGRSQYIGGTVDGSGGEVVFNNLGYAGIQGDLGVGEGFAFGSGGSWTWGTGGSGNGSGGAGAGGTGGAGGGGAGGGVNTFPTVGGRGGGVVPVSGAGAIIDGNTGLGINQGINQIISQMLQPNPGTIIYGLGGNGGGGLAYGGVGGSNTSGLTIVKN